MSKKEINAGYGEYVDVLSRQVSDKGTMVKRILKYLFNSFQLCMSVVAFCCFLALSTGILVYVALFRSISKNKDKPFSGAEKYVKDFVKIYPFHLYPIICKSLELYHLIDVIAVSKYSTIVEAAIGDGYMSSCAFSESTVFGFDISPYSLSKANYAHIKMKIVANCLVLPIVPDANNVIISNNLMHHITNKEKVIADWGSKAGVLIFNENTKNWSTAWPGAVVASFFGLSHFANRISVEIDKRSLQHLLDLDELNSIVSNEVHIVHEYTYYSRHVHSIALMYSYIFHRLIQKCFGPPTPNSFKKLLTIVKPFGKIAYWLTEKVAIALIRLDGLQSRGAHDVCVHYVCSTDVHDNHGSLVPQLACPECGSKLSGVNCSKCDKNYRVRSGMIFLCDEKISNEFSETVASAIQKHHL